ncbi:MAG TPA: alpha/beta hydrolase [Allosphingosinicella sp.]|nr:alpha/beta hydrolase [Allosphingosinicella sp.]
MSKVPISVRLRGAKSSGGSASLWKWGAGAAGAAAVGAAAFNAVRARRAEESNPPLGSFIQVDGVRLHYLERGSGPLVVLLHGNGTMIQDWLASGVLDALASTNRVIAFDRPGFGHSERPRSSIWTPAAQARLIAAALETMGPGGELGGATIVGHSFGTMVAAEIGLNHPEAASSLVLIGGYYYPSARVDAALAAPQALPGIGDAISYTVSPFLGAAMKPGMEAQMFGPAPVSAGWKADFPFEMTLRPSQLRAAAAEAALIVPAAASLAPRLSGLGMPVTLIAGAGDKVVSTADQSERLAGTLDRSELLVVEGAGHMVHHTAWEAVISAIRAASKKR